MVHGNVSTGSAADGSRRSNAARLEVRLWRRDAHGLRIGVALGLVLEIQIWVFCLQVAGRHGGFGLVVEVVLVVA